MTPDDLPHLQMLANILNQVPKDMATAKLLVPTYDWLQLRIEEASATAVVAVSKP